MANITLHVTGTIDFTSGSTALVGHSAFLDGLLSGDLVFAPDGRWYEIDTVTDLNNVTLTTNYLGTTVAASAGGTGWWILKSSQARDSVRTATKQLTDITSLYRRIINLTASDQTVRLSKSTAADRAGVILQKAGLDLFQAGSFEDDEFSVRYLLASTWTKALGVNPATGGVSLYSQLLLGNVISPVPLSATTNDYAPTGIDQANILRLSTNASRTLTGIAGGVAGRILAIFNVGNYELDLEDEGGPSLANNRFALEGNVTIPANGSALLIYDGVSSRWRQMTGSGGSGSGGVGLDGQKGWSPILSYVARGADYVAQISDWTGGEGAKPATGAYIGATGLVSLVADAIKVSGPAGQNVQLRQNTGARTVEWTYSGVIDWQTLISFDALTGPTSAPEWIFSTVTTDAVPGDGNIRFDNATFGSIGHIYIDTKTRVGADVSAYINSWDDSSSLTNRGVLSFSDVLNPAIFSIFLITGDIVTATGYFKIPVTPTAGGIPADARRLSAMFVRTGDKGIPGVAPLSAYNSATSYLIGDVAGQDGSSYISLVQPNLGHAPAFEADNAYWALFARGVNGAFVTAINLTLTNATAQAAAALASQQLSANYAVTINAFASGSDNSSKSWAIGGTGNGQPTAGDAKSWATKTSANVDGTDFSAKEYAKGSQVGTGGSAKNWAIQTGADVTGADLNSRSAKSWAQDALTGALGGSAKDWSITTTISVDGTNFSAKEYAAGSQLATGGSSKNWAQQIGSDVTGAAANSRSAKSWSQDALLGATLGGSARDWAVTTSATVDGVSFSSKEYAQGVQGSTGGSAKNWAQQIGADVTGAAANSRSARSWSQDSLLGATMGGSARDWAVTTSATVDGTLFSSKEYASGSQLLTGGSAKNWAQQAAAIVGAASSDRSARAWAQDDLSGALGGSAKNWATYILASVDGTNFSAKEYASGAQLLTGGSAKSWAQQSGSDVSGATINSRSAKSWAQDSLLGATLGGSSRDWAITTTATVDGTLFSAKEYAAGTQLATGGSAKNWSQQIGADVTGASLNSRSAKAWSQDVLTGATLGGSAKDWAITTASTVDGTLFSSKEYAQGAQAATGGSSKNWAQQLAADVTGAAANSRSAKSWAQENIVGATLGGSAKDWASYVGGTVDGVLYSAKYYATVAQTSETNVLSLEAIVATNKDTAVNAASSAVSSAATATTQAGVATTKAGLTAADAVTTAAQVALAVAAQAAAVVAKNDAATSATTISTHEANALAYRDAAIAAAAAAASAALILANPDYGFFVDTPSDTRDYGSFV